MLTILIPWLLMASVPDVTPPAGQSSRDDCEDTRRLELKLPILSPPRICISSGTLTGLIFDHPVEVELQDEVRFVEVTRGRRGIAFIPPRDLHPGETLRMTVATGTGEASERLTFVLVTYPGHGSHQIEVSYRPRSWQSILDDLSQALLANQRLRAENVALAEERLRVRAQLAQPMGLCGAFDGGQLSWGQGIVFRRVDISQSPMDTVKAVKLASYRGTSNIAVEVALTHQAPTPWLLEKATLVTEQGAQLKSLRHRQADALLSGKELPVFVEFDPTGFILGQATLQLTGTDGRAVTLTHVVFP